MYLGHSFNSIGAASPRQLGHPVFWFGYVPILTGRPRRIAASAKSPVWLAHIPQGAVGALLDQRPEWWRHLMQLSIIYGDVSMEGCAMTSLPHPVESARLDETHLLQRRMTVLRLDVEAWPNMEPATFVDLENSCYNGKQAMRRCLAH